MCNTNIMVHTRPGKIGISWVVLKIQKYWVLVVEFSLLIQNSVFQFLTVLIDRSTVKYGPYQFLHPLNPTLNPFLCLRPLKTLHT